MKCNQKGIDLIKQFEGLRLHAYKDIIGILTIGYGSTSNVTEGLTITAEEAENRLKNDLEKVEKQISALVAPKLSENEFAALCAFVYNLGIGNFKSSTLLKMLNGGADKKDVAKEFLKWNKAGGKVVDGLTRRRAAEMSLFLS